MLTSAFDYNLPPELIALEPLPRRDSSRLLVLHRQDGRLEHRQFRDLPVYLAPGDVLVLNDSRVIPARLRAANAKSGGRFEVLLLHENQFNDWWVMLRPGKRARIGTTIILHDLRGTATPVRATVLETNPEGHRRLRFEGTSNILAELAAMGEIPLPPYIVRSDLSRMEQDRQRYQTVYANPAGSVAAPTAGLHFTERLLDEIRGRGVRVCFVTLHVGLGTFAPVKSATIAGHVMHQESYELGAETVEVLLRAKASGGRVFAVGTTTVRVLESVAAQNQGRIVPCVGTTGIFIYPPCDFRVVDSLVTNFHLPRSTLLMLVSAFARPGQTHGRDLVLSTYAAAIRERYRFYSYGDAMLLV